MADKWTIFEVKHDGTEEKWVECESQAQADFWVSNYNENSQRRRNFVVKPN